MNASSNDILQMLVGNGDVRVEVVVGLGGNVIANGVTGHFRVVSTLALGVSTFAVLSATLSTVIFATTEGECVDLASSSTPV